MSNKCIKCGNVFSDDLNILNGCPYCNGRSFLYLTSNKQKIENISNLNNEIKIENKTKNKINCKKTLETIKILNPGSYELNLDSIFNNKDIIIELKEEGNYIVDLPSILKKNIKNK